MCLKYVVWRAKIPVGDSLKRSVIPTLSAVWTPILTGGPIKLSKARVPQDKHKDMEMIPTSSIDIWHIEAKNLKDEAEKKIGNPGGHLLSC
ncbi:hypothetical protein H5410_022354 [Solanum commersonii]|uniref:Uncharacterized protein n=1 Tax=Solanum commersonii TaxID=4109 RepID=A0A9J5ZDY3_SOLCO|nr:hypothetical protein H5410_022354 [Solanum commersonii]